jgi:uncharacterized protein
MTHMGGNGKRLNGWNKGTIMSKISTDKIWARTGEDEISANVFNVIIALTTVYGLAVFGLLAGLTVHVHYNWIEMIGLMVACMGAAFITASGNTLGSILGLSLMSGLLGAICGPFVSHYKIASVMDIALATVFIVLVLGAAGALYPKSLEHWGSLLLIALSALICVQFIEIICACFGFFHRGLHTIVDWFGVILFSGYIVYDFNRAQFVPKTVEHGIEIGVAIFLDAVNLFIRLLELFGMSSDD